MRDFDVSTQATAEPLSDADARRAALGYLSDAWEEGARDGLDGDCLAQTALFLALRELVATYGEEATATFADRLGKRIRAGEFTVPSCCQ